MAKDPELLAHQQWLGYLQPVGLVVSPPALLQAQAQAQAHVSLPVRLFATRSSGCQYRTSVAPFSIGVSHGIGLAGHPGSAGELAARSNSAAGI
jgi:hypothetical protein